MNLLPLSLKHVSEVCSKDAGSRFGATTGVQLETTETGYVATATDGRRFITVSGTHDSTEFYPVIPALAAAPNSARISVIPAKTWKDSFAKASRLVGKERVKPILSNLAVVQGENETTLAATNLESTMVESTRHVEGRFPNFRQVIPDITAAEYVINIDPYLLSETLLAMAKIGTSDNAKRISLVFFGDGKPMVMKTRDSSLPDVTGVLVPLVGEKASKNPLDHNGMVKNHSERFKRLLAAMRRIQDQKIGFSPKMREKLEMVENRRAELLTENGEQEQKIKRLEEKIELKDADVQALEGKLEDLEANYSEQEETIARLSARLAEIGELTIQWRDSQSIAGQVCRLAE